MRNKVIKTIFPTILGIATVLGLLVVINIIFYNADAFSKPDNGFFSLFVPITTLIALAIQFVLTLPFWEKFKSQKKVWRLTLLQFTAVLCIILGLIFGLMFWETSFGYSELFYVSLIGIIAFSIYWAINLLILKQLSKH
ncbi:MAG: hypothetical protein WBH98_03055 [Bacteroidales bacterium]